MLEQEAQDAVLQLDHVKTSSNSRIQDLKKRLEKETMRTEQKIDKFKKDKDLEMQKMKMLQGQVEDDQRYKYQEKISELEMQLKSKDQLIDKKNKQINEIENKLKLDQENNKELLKHYQQSEQQREQVESHLKRIESDLEYLQNDRSLTNRTTSQNHNDLPELKDQLMQQEQYTLKLEEQL